MSRSDDQRVADIRDAGAELEHVVSQGFDAFLANPIYRRGTERLLEIIGEAVNQLSLDFTSRHPELPWRDIAGLRIRLAHHYHRIDPAQVWVIARDYVPLLIETLRD